MRQVPTKYCLDTNVLIQAWNNHYSPTFCKSYWDVLSDFGQRGLVFVPGMVYREIVGTDDDLALWLKEVKLPIREINSSVTQKWKDILAKDDRHKYLVDNIKQRSLADPWVIAHALNEGAVVVTNENKETNPSSKRIKIPNVCESMGVECINEFEFIRRSSISFTCASPHCAA